MNTTNDGYLSRLFRVGNHGIEVGTSFDAVTVETGSFDKLAEFW